MKHHFRPSGFDQGVKRGAVVDIGVHETAALGHGQNVVQIGHRFRSQGEARHFRAHFRQPERQPRAFETCLSRDENAAARPEIRHHQHFQGAAPDDHSCSR